MNSEYAKGKINYTMKSLLFFLLLLKVSSISYAQQVVLDWSYSISGPSAESQSYTALDISGNMITAGMFMQTVDFDPSIGTTNLTSFGSADIFIKKTDANGTLLWAKQIGGAGEENLKQMVTDNNGNIYLTGYFKQTADFDPDLVNSFNLVSGGVLDAFMLKLDVDGNFSWVKHATGTAAGTYYGLSITIDGSGNIFNAGVFSGDMVNLDPGASNTSFPAFTSGSSSYLQKIDANGNLLWANFSSPTNGSSNITPMSLQTDANGDVYTSGSFSGIVKLDLTGANITLSANGLEDIVIHKFDASGVFLWAKTVGGSSTENATSSVISSNGYLYVAGQYKSDLLDFDSGTGVNTLPNSGEIQTKSFIEKIDATSGDLVWVKGFGGTTNNFAFYDIKKDLYGNLFACGAINTNQTSQPGTRCYLVKLDDSGNELFSHVVGGTPTDLDAICYGTSLACNSLGNIYLTGSFTGTVDLDASSGNSNLVSANADVFVLKLNQVYPCLTVLNEQDNGNNSAPIPGSLRAVLKCANTLNTHANINFAIPGPGPYSITLSGGSPAYITNPFGITIDGSTQLSSGVGSGSDQSVTIGTGALNLTSSVGPSVISNLSFSNNFVPSAINAQSDSLTILNNIFSNGTPIRINLTASSDSNQVVIRGNTLSAFSVGISLQNINNVIIENNTFNNTANAISVQACKQVNVLNNIINGFAVATGISINSSSIVTVAYNSTNGASTGINLVSVLSGSAHHNTIRNCTYGIQYSMSDFTLDNNTIYNYNAGGIYTSTGGGMINSVISNNVITKGIGTAIYANVSTGSVINNRIDTCSVGIDVPDNSGGATNALIANNTIEHFTSKGMDLGQSTNLTVFNNYIGNGTGYGIMIPRSHGNLKMHRNFIGLNPSLVPAGIDGCGVWFRLLGGLTNSSITNNVIGNITNAGNLDEAFGGGTALEYSFSSAQDTKISNNYIGIDSLNGSHPIISTAVRLALYGNNTFAFSNNRVGNSTNGLVTQDAREILIKQNTITNTVTPIDLRSSASGQGYSNKVSKNNFYNTSSLEAIHLNNAANPANNGKAEPLVANYSPANNNIIINGSGALQGDTIEVFVSKGASVKSIDYISFAVADASGNWHATVPLTVVNLPSSTQQDPTAVVLADVTDASGNTSELNYISPLPLYLCPSNASNNLPSTVSSCSGEFTLLDGTLSGATAYSWFNNTSNQIIGSASTFLTSTPGEYRLETTDSYNCTASDTITVEVGLLPAAAEFLMASEAGIGDEVLIYDISLQDRTTLLWNFGGGLATEEQYGYSVVFTDTGYKAVSVTTTLGNCTSKNTHYIHVGLESKGGTDGKVYPYTIKNATAVPNPSNGIFTLSVELTKLENVKVEVLNFMGMLVQTQSTSTAALNQNLPMDLTALSAGTYILRITSGVDSKVIRMTKEN